MTDRIVKDDTQPPILGPDFSRGFTARIRSRPGLRHGARCREPFERPVSKPVPKPVSRLVFEPVLKPVPYGLRGWRRAGFGGAVVRRLRASCGCCVGRVPRRPAQQWGYRSTLPYQAVALPVLREAAEAAASCWLKAWLLGRPFAGAGLRPVGSAVRRSRRQPGSKTARRRGRARARESASAIPCGNFSEEAFPGRSGARAYKPMPCPICPKCDSSPRRYRGELKNPFKLAWPCYIP